MIYFVPKIVLSFYPDRRGSSLPLGGFRSSMALTPCPPYVQNNSNDDVPAEQSRMQKEHAEEVVAILTEENRMLKEELKNLKESTAAIANQ
jgi:hypothetical protein